jgi:dienelactone hydrolase
MGHEVVLFHSALGLRPAVRDWAEQLRARGHQVHTPDLFEGKVFDELDDGVRERDRIGIPELIARAEAAVAEFPADLVYAGISMGTGPAELFATARPGAMGLILMHGALAPADIELPAWPQVPVQIHYVEGDQWVDVSSVRAIEEAARQSGAQCETYPYDRGVHVFEDAGLPGHDAEYARVMFDRVAAFLERI